MPILIQRSAAVVCFLLLAGCGYVGAPLTPLANVPLAVNDLGAVQRGDTIVIRFSVPSHTTENQVIKTPVKLDLRVGPAKVDFHDEEWAAGAKAITDSTVTNGIAIYRIPIGEWIGKEVVIGVRATGSNGKESGWSNYEILRVVPAPGTPTEPETRMVPAGIHLAWTGGGDQFRILRRTGNEQDFTVAQTAPGHEWTDNDVEIGKTYTYRIQALVDIGNRRFAESALSPVKEVVAKDEFPPAAPSGLRADSGGTSVVLAWEANTEPDLAGYRVYRGAGSDAMQKLADVNGIPSYTDAAVERGKTYHYSVSALDKSGNESGRSAAVEIVP